MQGGYGYQSTPQQQYMQQGWQLPQPYSSQYGNGYHAYGSSKVDGGMGGPSHGGNYQGNEFLNGNSYGSFGGGGGLQGAGFGSYGMNRMGGWLSAYRADEPPPVVHKLFSSRRDGSQLASQRSFNRHASEYSFRDRRFGSMVQGSTGSIMNAAPVYMPSGSGGISKDPEVKTKAKEAATPAVMAENGNKASQSAARPTSETTAPKQGKDDGKRHRPQSPVGYNIDIKSPTSRGRNEIKSDTSKKEKDTEDKKQKEASSPGPISAPLNVKRVPPKKEVEKVKTDTSGGDQAEYKKELEEKEDSKKDVGQTIPISRSLSVVSHNIPRVESFFGGNGSLNNLGSSTTFGSSKSIEVDSVMPEDGEEARPGSRSARTIPRRRSSMTRPRSFGRISMSIAEFPRGDEVQDMLAGELAHRRSVTSMLDIAGAEDAQLNDTNEGENSDTRKQAEGVQGRSRQSKMRGKVSDDQKRRDEEEKKKNMEIREQRKSEERKSYEENKRSEEERVRERVRSLSTSVEPTETAPQTQSPRGGRPSRMHQPSRRNPLMNVIPEQPPDVVAGTMRDNMADTLASREEHNERQSAISMERQRGSNTAADEVSKKGKEMGQQQQQKSQQDSKELKKINVLNTLLVVEKGPSGLSDLSVEGNTFTYLGKKHEATEIVLRDSNSMAYNSKLFNDVRDSVCDGHNASIVSVEAPNTGTLFNSPVWSGLIRIVRGVLKKSQTIPESTTELSAAFGFIHKDKIRDLFDNNNSSFETLTIHPSPIYGPRIPQLQYGKITSDSAFEDVMSSALRRANANPVLTTRDGMAVALILSRQCRIITNETGERISDVVLSSLVVVSSGSDPVPFESALGHVKNEYTMLFHLILGGPCFTCFMLSLAMVDNGSANQEVIEKLIELQSKMHASTNYPLRSGSVVRFVKYVESVNKEGMERLKTEENPERRSRLERYVQEQVRLLSDANKMLAEAREELRETFPNFD